MASVVFICLSAALSGEEFPGETYLSFPRGSKFICSGLLTCVLYLPLLEINSFLLLLIILKISPCPFSQPLQMPSEIPYLSQHRSGVSRVSVSRGSVSAPWR